MPDRQLPNSIRKFLRRKKAEIRRQFLSLEEAEGKIRELVEKTNLSYSKKSKAHVS